MSSIKNQKIGGDASVGRNVAMGGNGRIAGSLIIGHNLQVKGWLEAPNIKDTNKGVFASVESLNAAYPSPRNGWFAGVGESTPFDLYVAENGAWVATGGELDVEVDLDYYNGEIERIDGDIHDLTDDVSANSEAIEQHDGLIEGHTQQIAEIAETLTEVQQTATAAKEQSESNADSIGEHTEQIAELSSTVNVHSQSIAGHAQQIEQISGTLAETRGTADEAKYQSNANAVNISRVNALVGYYECSTPSSVSAKTITVNSFSRIVGGCMHIKMHFANTASSVTLNINGTGAIALYYNGKHVSARNTWEDDEIVVVFFDGDEYQAFPVGAKYIEQQSQPQPSQPEDFPELDELEERVGSLERAAGQHNVLPFDGTLSFPSVTPSDTLYEHTIQPREAFEYSICLISVLGSVRFCLKVGNTYYNNWSIKKQFSSDGLIPVGQGSIDDPYSVPTGTYTEEISNNDWYSGELHNKVFYNRSNKVVYAYNCETKSLEAMTNIQVVEENAPADESTSNPNNSTKGSIVVDLEHDKILTWDGQKWKALGGGGSVDIADLPNTLTIDNGVLYLKNTKEGNSTIISRVQLPVPEDGEDGKSAYELALQENPEVGTLQEWLASLKGTDGINGTDGEDGEDGKSAFQIWKEENNKPNASVREFLASLKESNFTSVAVQSLPTTDIDTNKIYCLPDSVNNTWTEYISDGTNWIALITHTGDLEVHSDVVDVDGLGTTLTEAIVGENTVPEEEQTQAYCTDFERTNDYAIGNDGKAYSLTGKAISEYIAVCPNTAYTCESSVWNKDSNIGLAFYEDANEDSYIEGSFKNDTDHYDVGTVSGIVPDNAKYIRVTWPKGTTGYYDSQNCLLYYKPTKEYYSKIERAGSFKTGEKVGDVEIDGTLQKDSEGLIKSGAVYEVTHAQIINRYDTPLLTGTIAKSYKGYIISAGKTVYDADLNIVKLIFNENIKDSAADITVTYYIADPDATSLGTSHTATIVAGTNYAVVDFVLPAGKLIYVKNQDVFASGDNYPSGCLIAGDQILGSEQSYYVLGGWHGNIYAGFSYEISKIVEIKEYVDRLNEETYNKIEELSKNSVYSVTWKDTKTVVVFGSSLTDQRYAPAGHIWLEEINHICNVNLINYALSGASLQGTNLNLAKELDFSPTWILWNNEANGTPYGLAGYKLLCAAMEITQSKGAIMMLGGENHTANEDNYPLKRVDKLFDVFAEEHHLCRSELRRERVLSLVGQTYPRFDGGIHYGWRNQAPFITKHLELLGNLPVSKSVKIYKLRPKSANLQISDLNYDTPLQRMKHFYALSTGVAYNGLQDTSQFEEVDNIKQGQNDNPQPYYANTLELVDIIKTRETEALLKGNDITIPNGKAVVEFTLEHTNVKSGIFKFKTSADSLQIYVAIAYNSSTTYDDNPRSTWQLVNDVTISSDDNSGYIVTVNVAGVIELYDNVKFLVVASGEFTIKQPEFEYEGGMKKNTPVLNYKPRKYGVEVNDNLHVDENDWTLTGNADIKQVPSTIGLYAANTYHIELSSQNDSASKTVTIPAGTKRVAIRVMAQRFVKIMTKLFAGTPDANSPYVSETQVINNYDCDLGVVDIIINDAAVSHHVVCPGFSWNYIEFAPDLTDTSLKIEVRKPDGDTAPIMVYMLSVQVIESEYLNTIKGIQTSISSVEQRLDSIEQANTGQ